MFQCNVCGSHERRTETISEVFQIDGRRVLVENIPVQVCAQCGEMTFGRVTTERVRRMVHGEAEPVGVVELEVFAYAQSRFPTPATTTGTHSRTHTRHRIGGRAKAMAVTSSREHAVRYKPVFDKQLEALLLERMDGNEDIFLRVMNDASFREAVSGYLVEAVYEQVRGEAP